uniref:Protein argonaute N-terminal domain-containing protein n=1 Tax=Oryza punctata TaxID=4537 RepID=A0A0E0KJZ0_ORYPU
MAYRGGGGCRGDPDRGGGGGGAGAPPYRPTAGSVWPLPGMTPRSRGPPPKYHQQPGHQPAVVYRAPSVKEVEQKLFVSETVLAPPAVAGEAPVSKEGLAHPARPGFGAAGKEVMIRGNRFLVNVADNNLFHYDYHQQPGHQPAVVYRAPSVKEVEQKLFVSETVLAPPAVAGEAPVSKEGLAHPARPGFGAAGKEVMIRGNRFLVNVADNNLFHYDVSINPESKSRATKAEREYKITIRIAGRIDVYHLQQFLLGRQRDMPQETIQVLDVVLRESPSWNVQISSLPSLVTVVTLVRDLSVAEPVTVIQFVEEFLNIGDTSRPTPPPDCSPFIPVKQNKNVDLDEW